MSPTAVFFDLDNTLLRGTSLIQLGKGLYARGYVSGRALARAAWLETWYRVSRAEDPNHTREARDTALAMIAGRPVREFGTHCEEIFAEKIRDKFCPRAVAVAGEHLAAGHAVWLITASPQEIAELCARHLGFAGGLGTLAEQSDGVYTGRLVNGLLHGPAKAVAVRHLVAEHGYDLTRSYAYSDSVNDLPMLSLTSHPHAVNPDAELRRHAEDHDWPVLEFRDSTPTRTLVTRGLMAGATLGLAARAIARRG